MAEKLYKSCTAVLLTSLLALSATFLAGCENSVHEISMNRFQQMVKEREVKRVVGNDNVAQIWLTAEAIGNSKYHGSLIDEKYNNGKPQLILQIRSEQAFRDELAALKPNFPIVSGK